MKFREPSPDPRSWESTRPHSRFSVLNRHPLAPIAGNVNGIGISALAAKRLHCQS